jgi:hypothetical protein
VTRLRDGKSRNRGSIPDRTDKRSVLSVNRPALGPIPPRSRWALGASFLEDEEARREADLPLPFTADVKI